MKTNFLQWGFIVATLLFFSSCHKDDAPEEALEETLTTQATPEDTTENTSKIFSSPGASWHSVPSSDETTGFVRPPASSTVKERDHDGDVVRSFSIERETSDWLFIKEATGNTPLRMRLPIGNQGHIGYAQRFNTSTNQYQNWLRYRYNSFRCRGNADKTAPSVICKTTSITLPAGTSLPNLVIPTYVTAIDDCQGDTVTITQSPASGTIIKEGTQTIVFSAKDKSGNTGFCSIKVVGDKPCNTPPTINCGITGRKLLIAGNRLPDYRSSFNVSNNCTSVTKTQSPNPRKRVRIGEQTITITATDENGNSSNCQFIVLGKKCGTKKPSIQTFDKFCFLSRHAVEATNTSADKYQWKVTGNAQIGQFSNGRLGLINSGTIYTTSKKVIDIYTGNGKFNHNFTQRILPEGNRVTIWVRARKGNCDWSDWKIVNKSTVRVCI